MNKQPNNEVMTEALTDHEVFKLGYAKGVDDTQRRIKAKQVPLTDEQIDKLEWLPSYENPMTLAEGLQHFARAVERHHGIGVTNG